MNQTRFESFFKEYKKMKIEDGFESWEMVESPLRI